eukprot:Em0005g571a
MSTALENEDRDFVTEDDLRAGNELVWVKNNNRLTVLVARQKPDTLKWGFSQQAQPWSKQTVDDYENMETQLTCGEECNATLSDELRHIRIAVEAILNHLISNTGNSVPTPNCQLTSSTTLTCNPPSTSKEAQAESQPKPINQTPEYFVTKNGVDLLKVQGTNVVKYALGLLDALYTEEELKQSSFVPVGKSTTSAKPPLSPERMKLFEDCLKQKFSASELKENVEAIRQSCTQKCRDKGKIMGMILGQGGMILGQEGKILGMILGQGGKILGMILGQEGKILGMILGQEGKILGMILGQGGKILDKILGMILVHGLDLGHDLDQDHGQDFFAGTRLDTTSLHIRNTTM